MANIITLIQSVFRPEEFDVIDRHYDDYQIFTKERKSCLMLNFIVNEIYIERLDRCGVNSGITLLQLVEELAKKMPRVETISLEDGSSISTPCENINIDLAHLKILTKGESWYNSLGYISHNYEAEKSHNAEIAQMPLEIALQFSVERQISELESFFSGLYEVLEDQNMIDRFKEENERKIQQIRLTSQIIQRDARRLFPNIDMGMGTGEYLNKVLETIHYRFDDSHDESCQKYKIIRDLIEMLKPLIMYSTQLQKRIIRAGGKRKQRKSKKRRSQKRKFKNGKTLKK